MSISFAKLTLLHSRTCSPTHRNPQPSVSSVPLWFNPLFFLLFLPPSSRTAHWVLRTAPPWPWGVTVVLFVAAALLIYWLYLRGATSTPRRWRIVLAALRLTLVAVIGFMFYCAELYPYRVDLPDLVVLLDNSASMSLTDGAEQGGAAATQAPDSPAATASRLARATDLLCIECAACCATGDRGIAFSCTHWTDSRCLSTKTCVRPSNRCGDFARRCRQVVWELPCRACSRPSAVVRRLRLFC